jgi:hypothetical protein
VRFDVFGLLPAIESDQRQPFFEAIVELTIWIADAHRGDGKRFIVRADE